MESSQKMNYLEQVSHFSAFQYLVSPCSSTVLPAKWGQQLIATASCPPLPSQDLHPGHAKASGKALLLGEEQECPGMIFESHLVKVMLSICPWLRGKVSEEKAYLKVTLQQTPEGCQRQH